ncbi:MAG: hypothetical protein AABW50_02755 [Nanoarchaeota archaeon]
MEARKKIEEARELREKVKGLDEVSRSGTDVTLTNGKKENYNGVVIYKDISGNSGYFFREKGANYERHLYKKDIVDMYTGTNGKGVIIQIDSSKRRMKRAV